MVSIFIAGCDVTACGATLSTLAVWSARTRPRFKSGDMSPHSKSKTVRDVKLVDLKTPYGFHESRRRTPREPRGGTPLVIFCQQNNTVSHWILVNIIEARQIGALICDVAVPKLKPHFSPRLIVPKIELRSGFHVKFAKKVPKPASLCR